MNRQKNRKSSGHASFVVGKVVFEFWSNEDESLRNRTLRDLAKELHLKLNVSAHPILDSVNLERSEIVFAGAADNEAGARALAKEVMEFLETNSSARIIHDSWIVEEIP